MKSGIISGIVPGHHEILQRIVLNYKSISAKEHKSVADGTTGALPAAKIALGTLDRPCDCPGVLTSGGLGCPGRATDSTC